MTVFRKLLSQLDIPQHTGNLEHSFAFMFLTELDKRETADPSADVLVNPLDEVPRRLDAYRDTAAFKSLQRLIESVRPRR